MLVFNVVPSVYDPSLAPEGKQCALVGTICTPDPDDAGRRGVLEQLEAMVGRLWPGIEACVESKERYSASDVSNLTRDRACPARAASASAWRRSSASAAATSPPRRAPVRGLYYVGCDAGGYGCGTHQAVDSGVRVADIVTREHRTRAAI